MNWLTKQQAKEAARMGDREALECSIEHWRQLSIATAKELNALAQAQGMEAICEFYCALCLRYRTRSRSCSKCPLSQAGHECEVVDYGDSLYGGSPRHGGSPWRIAHGAWWRVCNGRPGSIVKFRNAARRMLRVLNGLKKLEKENE